jgi:hypothetical protein
MSTDSERRAKARLASKLWREQNPEKHAAAQARYRAKQKALGDGVYDEYMRTARAKWKAENRDKHREAQRAHRFEVRREILTLLQGSASCKRCGMTDLRCLQIDHIHGSGRNDARTRQGTTNMWALRNWIAENPKEAKKRYQVLCANCNWIKRYENFEWYAGSSAAAEAEKVE